MHLHTFCHLCQAVANVIPVLFLLLPLDGGKGATEWFLLCFGHILSRIFDENMSYFKAFFCFCVIFFAFVLEPRRVQRDDAESKPLQVVHTGTAQKTDLFCVFFLIRWRLMQCNFTLGFCWYRCQMRNVRQTLRFQIQLPHSSRRWGHWLVVWRCLLKCLKG